MSELDKKISKGIEELKNRKVLESDFVVFGAGYCAGLLCDALMYRGYYPKAIIDNSKDKVEEEFRGYRIRFAPDYLHENHEYKYLVLSNYYNEIKIQLCENGFKEDVDFFSVVDLSVSNVPDDTKEFEMKVGSLRKARTVLENLQETYGTDCLFYVNPTSSIGDVYLLSNFYQHIENKRNALLILGTETLYRISLKAGIKKVLRIPMQDIHDLIVFASVFGFENTNIFMLHTGMVHFRIWSRMLTLKKITWLDHYSELFDTDRIGCVFPDIETDDKTVEKIFIDNNIPIGKTVILSPYANTVRQMSLFEWDKIVTAMKKIGLTSVTNIGGDSEIPVHGTIPIYINLDMLSAVVKKAGYFIGTRSGLCDFLVGSKAKKVVFYSQEIYDLVKVKDFYSMKKM